MAPHWDRPSLPWGGGGPAARSMASRLNLCIWNKSMRNGIVVPDPRMNLSFGLPGRNAPQLNIVGARQAWPETSRMSGISLGELSFAAPREGSGLHPKGGPADGAGPRCDHGITDAAYLRSRLYYWGCRVRSSWQSDRTGRRFRGTSTSIRLCRCRYRTLVGRGPVLKPRLEGPHHERRFWIEEDAEPWLVSARGHCANPAAARPLCLTPTAFRFGDIKIDKTSPLFVTAFERTLELKEGASATRNLSGCPKSQAEWPCVKSWKWYLDRDVWRTKK